MAYAALTTIHDPATGTVAPASWGDQIHTNFEFLIDPPACSVKHSTSETTTTATYSTLSANTENYDNNAMHSTVTNIDRITAQTAGRYEATACLQYAANATGARLLGFQINGTSTDGDAMQVQASAGGASTLLTASRTFTLAAGDYVECRARQESGGNLNVTLVEFALKFLTR